MLACIHMRSSSSRDALVTGGSGLAVQRASVYLSLVHEGILLLRSDCCPRVDASECALECEAPSIWRPSYTSCEDVGPECKLGERPCNRDFSRRPCLFGDTSTLECIVEFLVECLGGGGDGDDDEEKSMSGSYFVAARAGLRLPVIEPTPAFSGLLAVLSVSPGMAFSRSSPSHSP